VQQLAQLVAAAGRRAVSARSLLWHLSHFIEASNNALSDMTRPQKGCDTGSIRLQAAVGKLRKSYGVIKFENLLAVSNVDNIT
jgi:hypothetical protein